MKTFLLIDASALIYRFYHALPPLSAPDGSAIQGVYGITNVLLKILDTIKPDFAAAALDRKEKTFRKEQFAEYKSHRPPAPDDLIVQLIKLPEVFQAFNIKTFDKAGYEADDIIGTLSKNFTDEGVKTTILTGDLDVLQLVDDDRVVAEIIKSGLGNTDTYNEDKVLARYGLKPAQLADYKGFVGDVSDNIPGVKGIGPKSAQEILREFGSIEGVYENIGLINPSIAKKLDGQMENAVLCRKLATIERNVPLETHTLEDLALKPLDLDKLKAFSEKLGFTSIVKRLQK